MAFRDLSDVWGGAHPKVLPINGINIEFPDRISADAGMLLLTMRKAMQAKAGQPLGTLIAEAEGIVTQEQVAQIEAEILGNGAEDLDRLGVFGDERSHVVKTLVAWHLGGQEAAEAAWEGKAPSPTETTSKPRAGRARKTDGGGTTRSRAAARTATAARSATASSGRRSRNA